MSIIDSLIAVKCRIAPFDQGVQMDYAQQQRSPVKHLTGIAAAVILHVLVGYVLVNSRARKMLEVIQSPLEIMILKEVKKPPPPDMPSSPPRKMRKLPPAFVPQPEVQIQAPTEPQTAITHTTSVAPSAVNTPPGRRAGRGSGTGVGPSLVGVGVACPNSQHIRSEIAYPEQARRDKLEGNVLIDFTLLADGSIKDIDIRSSSDRVFNNVSVNAVRQFKCTAQGSDMRVSVPFVFKLDN